MGKKHKKNIKYLAPYIRELADNMELRDWTFIVSDSPTENKRLNATVYMVWGRKIVEIRLNKKFHLRDKESQRQTLVHELIHAHFAAIDNPLERMFNENQLAPFYVSAMELGVDAMANIIAPFMPLPPDK